MKKRKYFIILLVFVLALTACGRQKKEKVNEGQAEKVTAQEKEREFQLSEDGIKYLEKICKRMPDFEDRNNLPDEFWGDFVFGFYSAIQYENPEYDYKLQTGPRAGEEVARVSEQKAAEHLKLALGVEWGEYKPKVEDLDEGQTTLYYEDGYYYIGASDFPDREFTYKGCTAVEDESYLVEFNIKLHDDPNAGKFFITIIPADNQNGFVITSKRMELKAEYTEPEVKEEKKPDPVVSKTGNGKGKTNYTPNVEKEDTKKPEFKLTKDGIQYLEEMCLYLPYFNDRNEWKEDFWMDFLFNSYTGKSNYQNPVVKVSKEEAAAHMKLALGVDWPGYKPNTRDKLQVTFYYENGQYYIGGADLPDFKFTYKGYTPKGDGSYRVEFKAELKNNPDWGSNYVTIVPANNKNGFIITSKQRVPGKNVNLVKDGKVQLAQEAINYLERMCYYLPEFSDRKDWTKELWLDFLFNSYTGTTREHDIVKVSREDAAAHMKLALGMDWPECKPAARKEGQTPFYYKHGSYYIGGSDFGPLEFTYQGCSPRGDGSYLVEYNKKVGGGSEQARGKVYMTIVPANNPNGFIITSKQSVWDDELKLQLSEEGIDYLEKMCWYLPEFAGSGGWTEEFWMDFLFASYTRDYTEDMIDEETGLVKVSEEDVAVHMKLALGVDWPAYQPIPEDKEEKSTPYYQEGFYYIRPSDFPAYNFTYTGYSSRGNGSYQVEFKTGFQDNPDWGNIYMIIVPAENENGFIITAKWRVLNKG